MSLHACESRVVARAVIHDTFACTQHCCKEAVDELETGDISPYGDGWIDVKIILNILTGGLAIVVFPDMFNFNPPPRSEFARASTQRRRCPPGFPFNPKGSQDVRVNNGPFTKKIHCKEIRKSKTPKIPIIKLNHLFESLNKIGLLRRLDATLRLWVNPGTVNFTVGQANTADVNYRLVPGNNTFSNTCPLMVHCHGGANGIVPA